MIFCLLTFFYLVAGHLKTGHKGCLAQKVQLAINMKKKINLIGIYGIYCQYICVIDLSWLVKIDGHWPSSFFFFCIFMD